MAQTEAQKRAMKKYNEKNREKRNLLSMKSSCRSFIRNHATSEDLDAMEEIIEARRQILREGVISDE